MGGEEEEGGCEGEGGLTSRLPHARTGKDGNASIQTAMSY
jgi:hypothetical protein